jgi:menaquinone-specific isochorismate synthase
MTATVRNAVALTAYSEPVAPPRELLDHLGPDGFAWFDGEAGFVTSGVVAVLDPDDADDVVARIRHDAAPGTAAAAGPRAVGALEFDGGGRLVVPARIVARERDGRTWQTTIMHADVPIPAPRDVVPAKQYVISAASSRDEYVHAVRDALTEIDAGAFEKVVLAREVVVRADASFDVRSVLRTLRDAQPGCIVYADEGFVGASPELLVRRTGTTVTSRPMAGTGEDPRQLLASAKDGREHAIVVEAVAAALRDVCADLTIDGPAGVRLATVSHLATTITGTAPVSAPSAVALARRLHPTPAVGGWPSGPALAALRQLEPGTRGRYAGPCGWVDGRGDGEFVVALRCAQLAGAVARLHAGAGIVAGSRPDAEWAETQTKLEPMLTALIRP